VSLLVYIDIVFFCVLLRSHGTWNGRRTTSSDGYYSSMDVVCKHHELFGVPLNSRIELYMYQYGMNSQNHQVLHRSGLRR
jgi:hypothetical protein